MSHRFARLLALALLLLAAAPFAAAEEPPSVIRFGAVGAGYGQQVGTQMIAIAQVKGFVQQALGPAPVKLEWDYFTATGPAINEALAEKQLDFADYGSTPQIIARASGVPTKIVLSGGSTNIYGFVRSALPVKTVKDLKGLRVTMQKATILHWALLTSLAANGLSDRDVTLLDLKTADQLAALAAGSADAAFGTVSMMPLRDQGILRVIYSSRDDPRGGGPTAFVVTEDFAKKYPETTAKVVRGFVEAAHWLAEPANRDAVLRVWAQSGASYESLAEDHEGQALRDAMNPLMDDFFLAQYQSGIAFEKQQKLIRNDVDLAQWIDASYADKALKELQLEDYWPRRNASGSPVEVAAH